jgi:hypothetical protein
VKEGGLGNGWTQVATSVSTFRLTNARVGILQSGTFSVKEGSLSNRWTQLGTGVSSIDVSPNRVGMLQSGSLAVKEGSLSNGWNTIASSVPRSASSPPSFVQLMVRHIPAELERERRLTPGTAHPKRVMSAFSAGAIVRSVVR